MDETQEKRRPGIILEIIVLLCGAVVMAYEIIGARIVAPYIGTSIYVWTSLIGVILAALSIGYWIGGRIADRRPELSILAFAIFISGGLVSLTILISEPALSIVANAPVGLELKAVMAALLLFAPASVSLGFVIPYATKLRVSSLADTGKTVGRLNALSTIGSITGTFLAGFVMIPFIGSMRSLYMIAAALFILSLVLAPFVLTRITIASLILFISGVAANELSAYYLKSVHGVHDIDTAYSRIKVFETTDARSGKPMKVLTTDPYSVQSAIFPDSDELTLEYTKYYHLVGAYRPGHRRTLMIGGAGYSFPREHLLKYPSAAIDVVEIDPGMTQTARDHFRLNDSPKLRIFHEDGRVFLNHAESSSYDVVMMDAFGSLFSIPFHLTTLEAARQVHKVLDDDGIVILNLGSAFSGVASGFFEAELATYHEVFETVHVYKVDGSRKDTALQNIIIVAAKKEKGEPVSDSGINLETLLANRINTPSPQKEMILTDNLAPVEYYSSIARSAAGR